MESPQVGIAGRILDTPYGDFLKLRVLFLGVPILRTIEFWGSILSPPILGTLPYVLVLCD